VVTSVPISEESFTNSVIEYAQLQGWLVHHDRPARTDKGWRTAIQGDAGFPDLVLLRGGLFIFAELKTGKGKVTAEQKRWMDAIRPLPGVLKFVWRPDDWDEIELLLRRRVGERWEQ